ncbi:peptidase M56 family protein [Pseudarthrobacter sp. NPDC057230]|uniref:peptidase M56 family protein n=1 Tax=Pseudarthrobacter sp. NPDC057230 TaxID=3346057 RepID=UPI003633EB6C
MKPLYIDDVFSDALRAELIERVEKTSPTRTRRGTWLKAGIVVLAGVGVLSGVGATAGGLVSIPGSTQITPLASPVTETHTGTATVQLGPAPEGATGIDVQLNCLSPGRFTLEDGANIICSQADVGTRQDWSGYTIPLEAGDESITITTSPEARWKLTAQYVDAKTTDWGANANGDTYGAENDNGSPDLVAVIATNGTQGYAYRTDLDDANGTTASKTFKSPADALAWQESVKGKTFIVPVYDATGKTVVGEFVINAGGGASGISGETPGK